MARLDKRPPGWSVGVMASKKRNEQGRKGPPAIKPQPGKLPSKDDILQYVQAAQGKVGNREIARAFHLKGGDRIEMKRVLREMTADGQLLGNRKTLK